MNLLTQRIPSLIDKTLSKKFHMNKVHSALRMGLLLVIALLLQACGDTDKATTSDTGVVVRSDERPNVIFIFTDDQGYADVGAQGVLQDLKTPHLDDLAANGVRMTSAYVTSPQCTPSRAALMSGRYQQKFGVDDNRYTPFPLHQETLAEKLSDTGYKTGMVGKWHLEIDGNSEAWFQDVYAPSSSEAFSVHDIPEAEKRRYYPDKRGFQDVFFGYVNRYRANFNLKGKTIDTTTIEDSRFRVDVVSDAATTFIDRHKSDPFFLYVAYYAPHVPLEATEKYLSRFPGNMPERRRYSLAMMAAIDDGVGRIMAKLAQYGIDDDTIVFFMSDNGAPLAIHKEDVMPVSEGGDLWDGSLNDPWIGEKGMLSEGAIRVPYLVHWKGHLPEGLVYNEPVSTLDAAATAADLAGIELNDFDGVTLMPLLNGEELHAERELYWRFLRQAAIRKGQWKYLQVGNSKEYLFDLNSEEHEATNLLNENPEIAASLKQSLVDWAESLERPGLSTQNPSPAENQWYEHYFPD